MTRLDVGAVESSMIWLDRSVVVQIRVDQVVVSLTLTDCANLGVIEEFVPVLRDILKPFCAAMADGL